LYLYINSEFVCLHSVSHVINPIFELMQTIVCLKLNQNVLHIQNINKYKNDDLVSDLHKESVIFGPNLAR